MKTSACTGVLKALVVILLCLIVQSSYAYTGSSPAFYVYLVDTQSKLADYRRDFIDYAKNGQGNLEYEIPSDMNAVATATSTDVSHIIDLYNIYQRIDDDDKIRIRSIVIKSLSTTIKNISFNINAVNNGLSYAKRDVIVRSGSNLKQDLRQLKKHIVRFKSSLRN